MIVEEERDTDTVITVEAIVTRDRETDEVKQQYQIELPDGSVVRKESPANALKQFAAILKNDDTPFDWDDL